MNVKVMVWKINLEGTIIGLDRSVPSWKKEYRMHNASFEVHYPDTVALYIPSLLNL